MVQLSRFNKANGSLHMARLWRSVIVVGLCFAAVVTMRIYLNRQIELSKASNTMDVEPGDVVTR